MDTQPICDSLLYRPLPSSKNPHFQNEAKCTTFLVKMSFICIRMKNHLLIKGRALNLVLIQRPGGTRKWPFRDRCDAARRSAASVRYRNCADITILMCEQKPYYPVWSSCRRKNYRQPISFPGAYTLSYRERNAKKKVLSITHHTILFSWKLGWEIPFIPGWLADWKLGWISSDCFESFSPLRSSQQRYWGLNSDTK